MKSTLKVSRAVTKLACQDPFFGSCALRLDVHEDESVGTAATNGMFIKWNSDFIDNCSEDEVAGVICHEILHVLLEHCVDLKGRDPKMANIAMDLLINDIIINETSYSLPEGLIEPESRFSNKTWGQVYDIIINEDKYIEMAADPTLDDILDHIQDNKDLSDAEKEQLSEDLKQMATSAADAAEKQGANIPRHIKELIKEIRAPQISWKDALEATIKGNNPDDYTWARPNKKMLSEYDLYMPTTESNNIGNIVVGLDTSGSVSKKELKSFLAELHSITQTCSFESITILYTDCEVASAKTFYPGEDITELEVTGRGGTCFKPVFKYVDEAQMEVDQMIYFSDMEVCEDNFPEKTPYYPVLWLSTGENYPVPFGTLIKIK